MTIGRVTSSALSDLRPAVRMAGPAAAVRLPHEYSQVVWGDGIFGTHRMRRRSTSAVCGRPAGHQPNPISERDRMRTLNPGGRLHAGAHGTAPSKRTGRTGWPLPTSPGTG